MIWHILDANSIWIKEFASAFSSIAPTLSWAADYSWTGFARNGHREELQTDPPLRVRHFDLQRGYSRAPLSWVTRLGKVQAARMAQLPDADKSPLICTTPYYAPVAEEWPGPVVYYLTDMTKEYGGANRELVTRLDRRMCKVARLVCPNSQRIANYLRAEGGCREEQIEIIPQATRRRNVLPAVPDGPGPLPGDIAHLRRPVVGITGNLAENQDWILIRTVIDQNPEFSWAFIGPTNGSISKPPQRQAREELMRRGGSVVFTGAKPYGQLQAYARGFDVAFLPYQPRNEPTYSGSSTRFYEHLAACRPMISTSGFEELLHKEPLLKLADQAERVTALLTELKRNNFHDGQEENRWKASQLGTWEYRAETLKAALEARLS